MVSPAEAWSVWVKGCGVMGPGTLIVAADGVDIPSDANGPALPGRDAHLPAGRAAHQSTNQQILNPSFTAPSLICKPMQSNNDLIKLAHAGSSTGTVNEVAHCDEWMGEGFPWCNALTRTHQVFGSVSQKLALVL